MSEICPKCGLPREICVCQEIAKEGQKIKIRTERKRFGKVMTIIEGFGSDTDLSSLTKQLKRQLACGGTFKNNRIELQGDHREKVKEMLLKMNYDASQIDVC